MSCPIRRWALVFFIILVAATSERSDRHRLAHGRILSVERALRQNILVNGTTTISNEEAYRDLRDVLVKKWCTVMDDDVCTYFVYKNAPPYDSHKNWSAEQNAMQDAMSCKAHGSCSNLTDTSKCSEEDWNDCCRCLGSSRAGPWLVVRSKIKKAISLHLEKPCSTILDGMNCTENDDCYKWRFDHNTGNFTNRCKDICKEFFPTVLFQPPAYSTLQDELQYMKSCANSLDKARTSKCNTVCGAKEYLGIQFDKQLAQEKCANCYTEKIGTPCSSGEKRQKKTGPNRGPGVLRKTCCKELDCYMNNQFACSPRNNYWPSLGEAEKISHCNIPRGAQHYHGLVFERPLGNNSCRECYRATLCAGGYEEQHLLTPLAKIDVRCKETYGAKVCCRFELLS